ncbi:MAG TPA: hypothetical protein PLA50_19770, partial [Bacteroidia bacterium]|nr:hypothetical protein [Bacteroidia bacterium]
MATKTLIRLLVALAVLAAAAVVLHFMDSKGTVSKIDSSTDKRKVFADFPINDIAKVVIREKEATVTLTKGEKSWQVAEREDYAADSAPIIALLRKIWDL